MYIFLATLENGFPTYRKHLEYFFFSHKPELYLIPKRVCAGRMQHWAWIMASNHGPVWRTTRSVSRSTTNSLFQLDLQYSAVWFSSHFHTWDRLCNVFPVFAAALYNIRLFFHAVWKYIFMTHYLFYGEKRPVQCLCDKHELMLQRNKLR